MELDATGTVVGFEEKQAQPDGIRSGERGDVRVPPGRTQRTGAVSPPCDISY